METKAEPTPRAVPAGAPAAISVSGLGGVARGGVPLWISLPYLLTGAAGAALFGALLPLVGPDALIAPDMPQVLALVHVATLGWLTMTTLGASSQLAPVMLVTPLAASPLQRWQFPTYVAGVALLVTGFWVGRPVLLIAGGSLIIFAVVHHAVVLSRTLARAATRPLSARYLAASLIYLGLVVCLGLTAALNFQLGFLGGGADRLLLAHLTLGVAGWLTSMLIGMSYTLVRMFALAHGHDDRMGRRIFLLQNAGILGLATGFAFSSTPLVFVGGTLLSLAVWLFAYDYARMFHIRRRKPLDTTQRHGIASVAYLCILVPLGVAIALFGWATPGMLSALGLLALVGWVGQSILGYLYKIVPFLIWQTRFGPLAGRQKVPLMRDLIHEKWARASFWLVNGGLPIAALSFALGWPLPLQLGGAALGIGLLLGAANITHVVTHH